MTRTIRASIAALIFALIAACASAPEVTTVAPPPLDVMVAPVAGGALEPPEAAVRTARSVALTGMELGRMWTFQDPPLAWWRDTYDFTPSDDWLEKVRLSSLRYGDGCSASFVSRDGLVMTNHHCARECIDELSTEDVDYIEAGFYAGTRADELVCPGLVLDQLHSVEDVTDRVLGAGSDLESDTAQARARSEVSDTIDARCEAETGQTCQVVSLYHGGRYHLYRYRRFEPVKLVFAPEKQAAAFGGDPDNFTYPRYGLDVAFVRAYTDSATAAVTEHWFAWDADGADEGDVVFVVGNPGSTNRLRTVSQVMYMRARSHPFTLQYIDDVVDLYRFISSFGPDAERSVRDQLAQYENAQKAYRGELGGLQDTLLVGRKIRWEAELRSAVRADATLAAEYGDVWDRMAEIQAAKIPVEHRAAVYNAGFLGDPHFAAAGDLIRFVRESAKPPADRLEGYGEEELAELEESLEQPTPVNPDIAARLLAIRLRLARAFLAPNDPFLALAFRDGEAPEDAARRLTRASRILDVDYRTQLMRGGPSAIAAATDPVVRLARIAAEHYATLDARFQELEAEEAAQQARLARALFAVFGTDIPPDATFTLRITDGKVARYPYNGTFAAPFTTFHGMFERAAAFRNEFPWTLPPSFEAARARLALATPYNFVATTDITGGNSGSPMLSRDAEIVGVAFDGNIESLPNQFLYSEERARTVGVHSAGILEALRSIYQAEALVRELTGEGG